MPPGLRSGACDEGRRHQEAPRHASGKHRAPTSERGNAVLITAGRSQDFTFILFATDTGSLRRRYCSAGKSFAGSPGLRATSEASGPQGGRSEFCKRFRRVRQAPACHSSCIRRCAGARLSHPEPGRQGPAEGPDAVQHLKQNEYHAPDSRCGGDRRRGDPVRPRVVAEQEGLNSRRARAGHPRRWLPRACPALPSYPPAGSRAARRSSIRSSHVSMPTESRTRSSSAPQAAIPPWTHGSSGRGAR